MPRKQLFIFSLVALFTSGVCAQGDLTLTPQTLNFGDVYIGEPWPILSITIENVGDEEVRFGVPTLGDFNWIGSGCSPLSLGALGPGETCTQSIAFAPTSPGLVSVDIELESDAPDSPDIFTLTGNAIGVPRQIPTMPLYMLALTILTLLFVGIRRRRLIL